MYCGRCERVADEQNELGRLLFEIDDLSVAGRSHQLLVWSVVLFCPRACTVASRAERPTLFAVELRAPVDCPACHRYCLRSMMGGRRSHGIVTPGCLSVCQFVVARHKPATAEFLTLLAQCSEQGLYNGRASVCLSRHSSATLRCCGFAAVRPAGRRSIICCTTGAQRQRRRSTALSSKCEQRYVDS